MSSLFGGSQQQSSSTNQAYPTLSTALSPTIGNGSSASTAIANLLGLNGTQGQNQAFQNWQNSTGYQFGLNQGKDSITGNAATQGLLNSGATLKALDTYGQNYANTQYGNYVNQLQGLLSSGNQAAGVLSSAGNTSQSSGSSTGNAIASLFGGSGGASAGIGQLLAKGG